MERFTVLRQRAGGERVKIGSGIYIDGGILVTSTVWCAFVFFRHFFGVIYRETLNQLRIPDTFSSTGYPHTRLHGACGAR
jgi:hypothetical protein